MTVQREHASGRGQAEHLQSAGSHVAIVSLATSDPWAGICHCPHQGSHIWYLAANPCGPQDRSRQQGPPTQAEVPCPGICTFGSIETNAAYQELPISHSVLDRPGAGLRPER